MLTWTRALAVPGLGEPGPAGPAESIHKADVDDGVVYALLWGGGTLQAPYVAIFLFVPADFSEESKEPPPSRFPRFEEIYSAVDELLPEGVLMQTPAFDTVNSGKRELPRGAGGCQVNQIGLVPGTEAARRQSILEPTPGVIPHA